MHVDLASYHSTFLFCFYPAFASNYYISLPRICVFLCFVSIVFLYLGFLFFLYFSHLPILSLPLLLSLQCCLGDSFCRNPDFNTPVFTSEEVYGKVYKLQDNVMFCSTHHSGLLLWFFLTNTTFSHVGLECQQDSKTKTKDRKTGKRRITDQRKHHHHHHRQWK